MPCGALKREPSAFQNKVSGLIVEKKLMPFGALKLFEAENQLDSCFALR
jgi:hypothetical protein